jgi:hypothetical protein
MSGFLGLDPVDNPVGGSALYKFGLGVGEMQGVYANKCTRLKCLTRGFRENVEDKAFGGY